MLPLPDPSRLVIFTDQADWHLSRLKAALRGRGLTAVVASLRDVAFDSSCSEPIRIPGLGGALPSAVMVRGIAAGSFEAITLRLGVLHELEAAGVPVWNPPRAVERCVDKSATTLALLRAGLPTPATFVSEQEAAARAFAEAEIARGGKIVSKPLFGSQGKGLQLIEKMDDFPSAADVNGVWYLQHYVPPAGGRFCDHRLFVSAGRVIAGMTRAGTSWITNVHQGATPEPFAMTERAAELAISAACSVGAAFAGVDLIDRGEAGLAVLEVNSMPAWRGLQKVAGLDVADALIGDWLAASGFEEKGEDR